MYTFTGGYGEATVRFDKMANLYQARSPSWHSFRTLVCQRVHVDVLVLECMMKIRYM